MGSCIKIENKLQQEIKTFQDLPIDRAHKMALPIPGLKSRISSAIVWSLRDLRKKGVMTLLILSKSSNAYIKSQDGLRGFYSIKHENSDSWAYEVMGVFGFLSDTNIDPE